MQKLAAYVAAGQNTGLRPFAVSVGGFDAALQVGSHTFWGVGLDGLFCTEK